MKAVSTEWPSRKYGCAANSCCSEADLNQELFLEYSHDDDFELYVNGAQVVNTGHHARHEVVVKLDRSLLNAKEKKRYRCSLPEYRR